VTGLLPEDGLQLNPDAVHPPFAWQVALPADWTVLDTHPATWQRSLERLVDDRFAGQRLKAADRRQVLGFLDELVAACQRASTLISLVHIGRLASGGVASAGLQLAWYDSAPEPAGLAWVRQAAGRQGVVEEITTPAGTALLQQDRLSITPPATANRVSVRSLQVFLPLVGRTWTAVAATAGAHPEMQPFLRDLVITVAGSIVPLDDGNGGAAGTPAEGEPGSVYTPVDPPHAPGIQRGFGTLLVHRVDPEQADPQARPEKGPHG
jgi:hypothetical protein